MSLYFLSFAIPLRRCPLTIKRKKECNSFNYSTINHQMDSTKAEAENIEPSAGKELLDKYWTEIKHEIDDINIVNRTYLFIRNYD